MLQIIKLEVVPVVTRENPDWLKNQFSSFPTAIDLALSRFPDHSEWPEPDPAKQFSVAWFEGESFPDFNAVDLRLTEESELRVKQGLSPLVRTFPFDLATGVVPRVNEAWALAKEGKGPRWIYASSSKAFWRFDDGDLYLPYVYVKPDYRKVDANWVGSSFDDYGGFLVSCELPLAT